MTKNLIIAWFVLFAIYAILFILQVWTGFIDPITFFRLSITFWVLIAIDVVMIIIIYTLDEESSLKKWKHLW